MATLARFLKPDSVLLPDEPFEGECALRRMFVAVPSAVSLVFLAAGCSASDVPESAPSASGASPAAPLPPPGEDWELNRDGLMDLYLEERSHLAEIYNVEDPPEVELVRFTTPEEWADVQVECLSENGFAARVSQGGVVIEGDVPAEQGEAVNLAFYRCGAAYPSDPRSGQALPRVRAEQQYDHMVTVAASCVEGYGVVVSEPPSMETWLSHYYGDQPTWDPFNEAAEQLSLEELEAVYAGCSRNAPDLYPPISD